MLLKELVGISMLSLGNLLGLSCPKKFLSRKVIFTLICSVQKTKRTMVSDLNYFSKDCICFIHSCPLVIWEGLLFNALN